MHEPNRSLLIKHLKPSYPIQEVRRVSMPPSTTPPPPRSSRKGSIRWHRSPMTSPTAPTTATRCTPSASRRTPTSLSVTEAVAVLRPLRLIPRWPVFRWRGLELRCFLDILGYWVRLGFCAGCLKCGVERVTVVSAGSVYKVEVRAACRTWRGVCGWRHEAAGGRRRQTHWQEAEGACR